MMVLLVDDGVSLEKALILIMNQMGEQQEHFSNRMLLETFLD